MVMDYSEKRPGGIREGGERKPVQKNKSRKQPIGIFALLSVAVLGFTFAAGVFTGWLVFKGVKKGPAAAVAAQPAKKDAPAAPSQPNAPPVDPQLTFYKTLPAGGVAAMGSGLNLKKPEAPPLPRQAAPAAQAPAPQAPAAGQAKAAAPASQEKGEQGFVVQIASYRDRKEAETAQGKLAAKGVAAYVVEFKLPDKGVWYRIRVGKHLSKGEAEALAGKTGKGAMVVSE